MLPVSLTSAVICKMKWTNKEPVTLRDEVKTDHYQNKFQAGSCSGHTSTCVTHLLTFLTGHFKDWE